jgi:hypothetical protein
VNPLDRVNRDQRAGIIRFETVAAREAMPVQPSVFAGRSN